MPKEIKENWKKNNIMGCQKCGKLLIPDKKSINFKTKKWDRHSYKYNCDCFNKNIRISIG